MKNFCIFTRLAIDSNVSIGFVLVACLTFGCATASSAVEPGCPGSAAPDSAIIFCDDFESSEPLTSRYFEYSDNDGNFIRQSGIGLNDSFGMRALWQTGGVGAGSIKRTFGRTPSGSGILSQSHTNQDFREIYWRQYLKMKSPWTGAPSKLSRATSFGSSSGWAQAMIAHVWSATDQPILIIDPASGIDLNSRLITTTYNDFANLHWLGAKAGPTEIFASKAADRWFCIEAHVKLNSAGKSDGVFDLWLDGEVEASSQGLNWVGSWNSYGINTIMFENYWNDGAPAERIRYFDNIVISTKRIGCSPSSNTSSNTIEPPRNLTAKANTAN